VVLYVFRPPEHESELYFSEHLLVQVLGFLSTLPVPHCTIFPMIGRYQIYVMYVIAQMVLAGRTIFPMIGQYQIYVIM